MKIDWHNVTTWGKSVAAAGVSVAAAIVANNLLPPDSKGYAVASLVTLAAGILTHQSTNPATFPQTPIVLPAPKAP